MISVVKYVIGKCISNKEPNSSEIINYNDRNKIPVAAVQPYMPGCQTSCTGGQFPPSYHNIGVIWQICLTGIHFISVLHSLECMFTWYFISNCRLYMFSVVQKTRRVVLNFSVYLMSTEMFNMLTTCSTQATFKVERLQEHDSALMMYCQESTVCIGHIARMWFTHRVICYHPLVII